MGEYTEVVWAAYLAAAILLGACVLISLHGLKKAKKQLKEWGE